jgi:hypothetical protein
MSIYKETRPDIWTVMNSNYSNINKVSKTIHYEDKKYSNITTICGIARIIHIKTEFNVTTNKELVTCKKCLKIMNNNKNKI